MWNSGTTLVISSPNIGGLCITADNGIRVVDTVSTTGLSADESLFVRALQQEDHAVFDLRHRDGSRNRLAFRDIWDIHDIYLKDGLLYAVSSGSNEVVLIDIHKGAIVRRWKFPGEHDSWHLNCLDRWNGRMVLSAFGRFHVHREYIGNSRDKGFVMDLESSEVLWDRLTEPHSPRREGARRYVCDSGTGRLVVAEGRSVIAAVQVQGYPRGLAVLEQSIAVGISRRRNSASGGSGSVKLLDKYSFQPMHEISLPFLEVYDVLPISAQLAAQLLN
jgi:hypothetical protein